MDALREKVLLKGITEAEAVSPVFHSSFFFPTVLLNIIFSLPPTVSEIHHVALGA